MAPVITFAFILAVLHAWIIVIILVKERAKAVVKGHVRVVV